MVKPTLRQQLQSLQVIVIIPSLLIFSKAYFLERRQFESLMKKFDAQNSMKLSLKKYKKFIILHTMLFRA